MKVMLDEGAIAPVKAHKTDAGWDLFAKEDFTVPACLYYHLLDTIEVGSVIHNTGVHIEIPEGYVGFIKSKSGLNVNKGITADGVIDAGYTGPIVVKLYNHAKKPYHFNKGDKITQLVVLPICTDSEVQLVDSLNDTERGNNGFGSTGK